MWTYDGWLSVKYKITFDNIEMRSEESSSKEPICFLLWYFLSELQESVGVFWALPIDTFRMVWVKYG